MADRNPTMSSFHLAELAQTLFEEGCDAIFLFDPASEKLLDANPLALRLTGYSRKEIRNLSLREMFRGENDQGLEKLRQSYAKTGMFKSHEGFLLHSKGSTDLIPVKLSITRLHLDSKVLGLITARDVREVREVQAMFLQTEAELTRVHNCISDYLWSAEIDRQGYWNYRYFSQVVERITGRQAEFYLPGIECWFSTLHPEDRRVIEQTITRLQLSDETHCEMEYRIIRPEGTVRHVRDSITITRGLEMTRFDGVVSDITDRHLAVAALCTSEAKYRTLIENLEHCIFLKDVNGRFVAANRPFCKLLCRTEAEIIGMTDFDFFPPHLALKYQEDDRHVISQEQALELEEENCSDGQHRIVRVCKTPVRDGQGKIDGVLGIFWDVTHQRQLESQLRQAHKLEAVGQLAGGVAHDFNNLLTAILGNVSLILSKLPENDPNREFLITTEKAALRAADLTRQLLGFSRRSQLKMTSLDVQPVLHETVKLLERTIDPKISLEVLVCREPWNVLGDASQMSQVLLNLCLNARDAMPQGGKMTLSLENVTLDEIEAQQFAHGRSGKFIRLSVADTGQGIPDELRERIFEPFFTTKGPDKGTGLGLAMVYGIIEQHAGWMKVTSKIGQGTRFDIYVPIYSAETAASRGQARINFALPRKSGSRSRRA